MDYTDFTTWIPVLPSIQTYLSLFFSKVYLTHNGADMEWLLKCAFYFMVNVIVLAPCLGPSMRLRLVLFGLFDVLPILAFIHLISWDWNYGPTEMKAYREAYKCLAPESGEELAYRKNILARVNSIFVWTLDEGQGTSIRADIYSSLPEYFANRDKRLQKIESDYVTTGNWWNYRHGIDGLDTELPRGLVEGPGAQLNPRFVVFAAYTSLFIGALIVSVPLQGPILIMLGRLAQNLKDNGLGKRLSQYNVVEAYDGAFKGSFSYQAPYLICGDMKLLMLGKWNPAEPNEFFVGTGTVLKFYKRELPRRSIFEQGT